MSTKSLTFSSLIYGTPIITLDKLIGSENYLSWANSVERWFIDNDYEDHLTTPETNISKDERPQWRKTDALLCNTLRESIDVKTLQLHEVYKTCYTF